MPNRRITSRTPTSTFWASAQAGRILCLRNYYPAGLSFIKSGVLQFVLEESLKRLQMRWVWGVSFKVNA